jgi:hypothetical protein
MSDGLGLEAHLCEFFNPISRWAIAPVFQLLDIRREPGLRLSVCVTRKLIS